MDTLRLAAKVMIGTGSLDHVALLAYTLMTSVCMSSGCHREEVDLLMQDALDAACEICATTKVEDTTSLPVLRISIVHARLHNDTSWIVAALAQFAEASEGDVFHAAQYLKFVDPTTESKVDEIMKDQPGWEPGSVAEAPFQSGFVKMEKLHGRIPRNVIFLIDRTYDPILQPAIDAIKDILQSTVRRQPIARQA